MKTNNTMKSMGKNFVEINNKFSCCFIVRFEERWVGKGEYFCVVFIRNLRNFNTLENSF
jgi:hypothetical protein